jgi:hypothetical protein
MAWVMRLITVSASGIVASVLSSSHLRGNRVFSSFRPWKWDRFCFSFYCGHGCSIGRVRPSRRYGSISSVSRCTISGFLGIDLPLARIVRDVVKLALRSARLRRLLGRLSEPTVGVKPFKQRFVTEPRDQLPVSLADRQHSSRPCRLVGDRLPDRLLKTAEQDGKDVEAVLAGPLR